MVGDSFLWIQLLLTKGVASVFFLSFLIQLRQFQGLAGENGILPVKEFVKQEKFWNSVSIFHLVNSDLALKFASVTGLLMSLLVIIGIPSLLSPLFSSIIWFLMWLLLLSFYNTGQEFYSHYWDLILLEAGFLCIFFGGIYTESSELLILLFRWLLFRMMLGSGLIKIHGDDAWTDLSALKYHFETQVFPNPFSWHWHHLPDKLLELGVVGTHLILLILPFFYFLPQPFAATAGVITILYQIILFLGGNYTWLNLITAILALSTFNDNLLTTLLGNNTFISTAAYPYSSTPVLLAGFIAVLSLPVLKNMLSKNQAQNVTFDSLHLVNSYGAFEYVNRERREIILECLTDEGWEEYLHYEKPGPVNEIPPQVSPYFHRLDYPFKFADENPEERQEWLEKLMKKLKQGSGQVESLFREIPEKEPNNIRASLYKYRFTTPEERGETGNWWKREYEKILAVKN